MKVPKKLQREWDKKLEESGFEDIEDENGRLRRWSNKLLIKNEHENIRDSWALTAHYYDLCTQFLNDYRFKTKLRESIWAYHAEGLSYRNIVKILAGIGIKTNRTAIMHIINYYEQKMIEKYLK